MVLAYYLWLCWKFLASSTAFLVKCTYNIHFCWICFAEYFFSCAITESIGAVLGILLSNIKENCGACVILWISGRLTLSTRFSKDRRWDVVGHAASWKSALIVQHKHPRLRSIGQLFRQQKKWIFIWMAVDPYIWTILGINHEMIFISWSIAWNKCIPESIKKTCIAYAW